MLMGSRLLDNTLVVFTSECSDGDAHSASDLPIVLAGNLDNGLITGQHLAMGGVALVISSDDRCTVDGGVVEQLRRGWDWGAESGAPLRVPWQHPFCPSYLRRQTSPSTAISHTICSGAGLLLQAQPSAF